MSCVGEDNVKSGPLEGHLTADESGAIEAHSVQVETKWESRGRMEREGKVGEGGRNRKWERKGRNRKGERKRRNRKGERKRRKRGRGEREGEEKEREGRKRRRERVGEEDKVRDRGRKIKSGGGLWPGNVCRIGCVSPTQQVAAPIW